ncbi:MAG: hypothetical protein FJY67_07740 [Calditrichaeota bacterium]|nr:hypothetical protein [Calditrichota bacterium]
MSSEFDVTLYYIAFTAYFGGFASFSLNAALKGAFWHRTGAALMTFGLLPHTAAFIARWQLTGHVPLSNMYEYMSAMSWMAVLTLLYVYRRYGRPEIGTFISPVVFMLMVAGALLPKEASQSLMPALRSVWLIIHVALAALGAGCFLVSFAGSSIYLLTRYQPLAKKRGDAKPDASLIWKFLLLGPLAIALVASLVGLKPPTPSSSFGPAGDAVNLGGFFILTGMAFLLGTAVTPFLWRRRRAGDSSGLGGWLFIGLLTCFLTGALAEGLLLKADWLQLTHQLPTASGESAKSAWLIFEFIGIAYLLGALLSAPILSILSRVNRDENRRQILTLDLLDEIGYKAASLGYPLYTVGALFAGAIWAEQAWGQFWSWDPKEVGSLITWLFYSGYLHARYQHGWTGSRAAILSVIGFLIVLLSFFGNYFFGGLHAYA